MKLFDRFEIIDNYPALYIEDIDSVVISDLHLGLESLMAHSGTLMPKFQLSEIKQEIKEILERKNPKNLIINGDVKHRFSRTSHGERVEVKEFINSLTELVDEIIILKGNHDNYLIYITKEYENVELADYKIIDDICFLHGHKDEKTLEMEKCNYFVLGHEHPAVALRDRVGVKEKVPCFLYGDMKNGKKIVVLPAFSKMARGSQVNKVNEKRLLSPFLKNETDLKELRAVGIDREAGLFPFPELKNTKIMG